jgi:hypothetical protein
LCSVAVQFSAIQSALNCGNQVFISTGASVPGVIWKTMVTPSTTTVWPVRVSVSVGAITPVVPSETVWPSPPLTPPVGLRGSIAPYM